MNRLLVIIVLLLICISCDNALFNEGDIITKSIKVDYFEEIYVEDIFEIELIQDTVCKIEAKGGSNLLPNLEFKVEDKKLTIDNNNSARWSRDYDKIKLFISIENLTWFELNSPSKVTCRDTLTIPHVYFLSIDDYSEMDIVIKSNYCYVVNSGTSGGIFNISGTTDSFIFWARASFQINAQNLIANDVILKSESIADCSVHANEYIKVEILNEGNVFYTGNPGTIEYVNDRARKQLIKLD